MSPSDQTDLFAEPPPAAVGPRGNILVGTCSWTDPSLIKSKRFYPRGTHSAEARLRYYASRFPVVEVDSSYFAMPSPMNAALWAERTPASFKFSVKAFRLFTGHQTPPEAFPADIQLLLPEPKGRARNLYYADIPAELQDELWRRFTEALTPLEQAGKLLATHCQFAPWVTASPEWVAHVEQCVERLAGNPVALEFRNQSWLGPDVREHTLEWERRLGVVHVVVDEPSVGNFAHSVWAVTHPGLAIVRLHGRNADTWNAKGLTASSDRFNYEYSDEEIADLATGIVELAMHSLRVVVLLNVNHEDQGTRAAKRLEDLMRTFT